MNKISRMKLAAPLALALAPFVSGFAPGAHAAINLNGIGYVQYGDAQSYSLPIACMQVGQAYPGCVYKTDSSPGQIADLIVVATGSNGGPLNTNFNGMDNAYSTPTGQNGEAFFQTGGITVSGTTYPAPDPTAEPDFAGDNTDTWDTTVGALQTFLGGDALVFFFNNNQEKSLGTAAETLAAWMQVSVEWTDGSGSHVAYFDLTNNNGKYALVSEGGGGTFQGNVANYTNTTGAGPDGDGTNNNTDYVLSGGAVCVATGGGNTPAPVPCGSPLSYDPPGIPGSQTLADLGFTAVTTGIDHNLGANDAAYAVLFPELNTLLAQLIADNNLSAIMRVDLRLGCDPTLYGTDEDAEICSGELSGFGKSLNNGYEQLFIGRAVQPPRPPVPAPGTLALMAGGLLGVGALLRRRTGNARG